MSGRIDIDEILRKWPFEPGVVAARSVRAHDGRTVIQMRVELGVLQMETEGRPDGHRPGGLETYLDYLIQESLFHGDGFQLSEEQCIEVDREFVQYYQRRICWMALRQFDQAVRDADHSLALMDFVYDRAPDEEWLLSHEEYRPFVVFHRTQAAALSHLEASSPEPAIEAINHGLEQMRRAYGRFDTDDDVEDNDMFEQLVDLRQWLREHYRVGRTLSEQLADAVNAEKYELAAKLRDEIARRRSRNA